MSKGYSCQAELNDNSELADKESLTRRSSLPSASVLPNGTSYQNIPVYTAIVEQEEATNLMITATGNGDKLNGDSPSQVDDNKVVEVPCYGIYPTRCCGYFSFVSLSIPGLCRKLAYGVFDSAISGVCQ